MPTPVVRLAHPNGSGDRRGTPVDTVILHTTEGTAAGALAWFQDPAAKVAAHYLIDPVGRIYSCVPEARAAWHAGHYGYNLRSIGIECAGHAAELGTWTGALVESLVQLLLDICQRHDLVVPDRVHIIGHAEVPDPAHPGRFGGAGGHTDPGTLIPWDFILGELHRRLAATAAPPEIA